MDVNLFYTSRYIKINETPDSLGLRSGDISTDHDELVDDENSDYSTNVEQQQQVTLHFSRNNGKHRTSLRCAKHDTFREIKTAYFRRTKIKLDKVSFYFENQYVRVVETPESLGMVNGSVICVYGKE